MHAHSRNAAPMSSSARARGRCTDAQHSQIMWAHLCRKYPGSTGSGYGKQIGELNSFSQLMETVPNEVWAANVSDECVTEQFSGIVIFTYISVAEMIEPQTHCRCYTLVRAHSHKHERVCVCVRLCEFKLSVELTYTIHHESSTHSASTPPNAIYNNIHTLEDCVHIIPHINVHLRSVLYF